MKTREVRISISLPGNEKSRPDRPSGEVCDRKQTREDGVRCSGAVRGVQGLAGGRNGTDGAGWVGKSFIKRISGLCE